MTLVGDVGGYGDLTAIGVRNFVIPAKDFPMGGRRASMHNECVVALQLGVA